MPQISASLLPQWAWPVRLQRASRWWSGWSLAPRTVALLLALWCIALLNQPLWHTLSELAGATELTDPWALKRLALGALLVCATFLWFMLWSWPGVRRPVWSVHLVLAASVQHFMLSYGVVMDSSMVQNSLQTNWTEALALLTPGLLLHVLLYAGLPIAWLYTGVEMPAQRRGWLRSAGWLVVALTVLVVGGMRLYRDLAPLLRNHTEIRYQVNPLATVVSWSNVTLKPILKPKKPFQPVIEGAALGATYRAQAAGQVKPPLLVLVVGETARADHFGRMYGYARDTTPQLQARQVLSWQQVQSCGTNTIASVPCMFSPVGKEGYEGRKVEYGNLLDIVQAAGLAVRWLDNQSGCKGVCARIPSSEAQAIATPEQRAQWCRDGECLDRLMVAQLDAQLAAIPAAQRQQGVVLVLHQMGSHGPAYYRRSAPDTKHFTPECATHVTSDCSQQDLINVYDNSMVETDAFLAQTIDWLHTQQQGFATSMLYVSDHGESLGENGLYLHGLPYRIAPQAQKHVPWVLWPGTLQARTGWREDCARTQLNQPLTHDAYFHTVLGMLDVSSPYYQPQQDAMASCRTQRVAGVGG